MDGKLVKSGAQHTGRFSLSSKVPEATSYVQCEWMLATDLIDEGSVKFFQSLDLWTRSVEAPSIQAAAESCPAFVDATGTALHTLLDRLIETRVDFFEGSAILTKAILAPHDGYVTRSDILNVRMQNSEWFGSAVTFWPWDKRLPAYHRQSQSDLLQLLHSSCGAAVAKGRADPNARREMRNDLEMRLSLNMVITSKPAAYNLGLVAGRSMNDPSKKLFRSRGFLESAKAMGVAVTILDAPGHWMQGQSIEGLWVNLVPVDLSLDAGLPYRLADTTKNLGLDGIVTFTDEYVVATTHAAEILGLPTEPLQATLQCVHKHKMREIVNESNVQTVFLESPDQIDDPGVSEKIKNLRYPIIVKPTFGRASAGVKRVDGEPMLRDAVKLLAESHIADEGILLETFIDGPELDCNFVLCDGEVLYLEITDDLPSSGDRSGAGMDDHFFETIMVSNTALPSIEMEVVRSSIYRSLKQLGLRWGVFHTEGRMIHSTMEYREEDGIEDLCVINDGKSGLANGVHQPEVFLIEVNVRPPGNGGTWTTLFTYGVDYNALHILRAVGDRARFVALAEPFRFPANAGGGGGAQFWGGDCLLDQHRNGIVVPGNFFQRLWAALPGVEAHINRQEMCVAPGSITSLKGGVGILAWVSMYSRQSRRHLLEMYWRMVEETKRIVDGQN